MCIPDCPLIRKLPPHFSGADELGQEAVVAPLVTDPASDDCRVDSQALGQVDYPVGRWVLPDRAYIPDIFGYQRLSRQQVCVPFFGISGIACACLDAPKVVVIYEAASSPQTSR